MNEIQKIDTITAEILILKQQTAQNIIEIGKRLTVVKESLPHGEWGRWLEEKVDFSQMQATRFIRVANEFGNNANLTTLLNFNTSKIYALLDVPAEERESFISQPHEINGQSKTIDEMTTRELQHAIKEKKELEEKLQAAEKKAETEHQAWETISKSYKKLEETNKKQYANAEKIKNELKSIEERNKEALVNKEVEIENLRFHIDEIKRKLNEAESSGDSKEIENLQESLQQRESTLIDALKKIEDLEEQLKAKPIEVVASPQVIEKIPEDVERELLELRAKANQPASSDKTVVKFSLQFDGLVKGFKELLGTLEEIESSETKEKYRNAVNGLINKMIERL